MTKSGGYRDFFVTFIIFYFFGEKKTRHIWQKPNSYKSWIGRIEM